MERIYIYLVVAFLSASIFAQSPEKMSYQAVIRNSSDALITNTSIGMQISILQGSSNGQPVYVETQIPTTNMNGIISIEIGNGSVISGNFANIDWENGPYFIKIETDPEGGNNYSISGTSELLSVPYAFHAKTAEIVTGANVETDPIFGSSVAAGITEADTNKWNNKLDSYTELQTLADVAAIDNSVNTQIKNVSNPTDKQDAVNKAYVDALDRKLTKLSNTMIAGGYVSDYDGNYYNTVKVGNQLWMAENLKTTHYSDGKAIPKIADPITWINLTNEAYCWYNNDSLQYKNIYGALYNWYAVTDSSNLCPTGWHIPSDSEWASLSLYLDSAAIDSITEESTIAGFLLKSNTGWNYDGNGNDSIGFTALPGGYRARIDGLFYGIGDRGHWWTISESNSTDAWNRNIYYYDNYILRGSYNKAGGLSVRCIKD